MILVENPSFGLPSSIVVGNSSATSVNTAISSASSASSYYSYSSASTSTTSSTSSTPAPHLQSSSSFNPYQQQPGSSGSSSSSGSSENEFVFDLFTTTSVNDPKNSTSSSSLLLLDDIDQFLTQQEQEHHQQPQLQPEQDLDRILIGNCSNNLILSSTSSTSSSSAAPESCFEKTFLENHHLNHNHTTTTTNDNHRQQELPIEEDIEDEDLKFLELDLLNGDGDHSMQLAEDEQNHDHYQSDLFEYFKDQQQQLNHSYHHHHHHDYLHHLDLTLMTTNFDDELDSLTPSVQRLFQSTGLNSNNSTIQLNSMSEFNNNNNNRNNNRNSSSSNIGQPSGFCNKFGPSSSSSSTSSSPSPSSSLIHHHSNPQQQQYIRQQPLPLTFRSSGTSGSGLQHHQIQQQQPRQRLLLRQDSQTSFGGSGSCCSSSNSSISGGGGLTQNTFDSYGGGGGGSSSTTSSTPSTPSSLVGGITVSSSSSSSSGAPTPSSTSSSSTTSSLLTSSSSSAASTITLTQIEQQQQSSLSSTSSMKSTITTSTSTTAAALPGHSSPTKSKIPATIQTTSGSAIMVGTTQQQLLPSFNEIYSPTRFSTNIGDNITSRQMIISNPHQHHHHHHQHHVVHHHPNPSHHHPQQQQHHHHHHLQQHQHHQQPEALNFDYSNTERRSSDDAASAVTTATTISDYFKFEDCISESESDLDLQATNHQFNRIIVGGESSPIHATGASASASSGASSPPPPPHGSSIIRIKEESMDTDEQLISGFDSHQIQTTSNLDQLIEVSSATTGSDTGATSSSAIVVYTAAAAAAAAAAAGQPTCFSPQSLLTPLSVGGGFGGGVDDEDEDDEDDVDDDDDRDDQDDHDHNDCDDQMDQKILTTTETDFIFQHSHSATTSSQSSPQPSVAVGGSNLLAKTMRIDLHNLSLNVLNNPPSSVGTTSLASLPAAVAAAASSSSLSLSYEPFTTAQQDLLGGETSSSIGGGDESKMSIHLAQQQHPTELIQLQPSTSSTLAGLIYQPDLTQLSLSAQQQLSPQPQPTTTLTCSKTYRTTPSTGTKSSGTTSTMVGGGHQRGGGGGHHHHKAKSSSMQTCAVCGDVAACQHYGVLTCEGCKGFFKRTVQKGSKYTCLGGKDCTVDKRRRNRCQFCRFQKCLAVGMVKEVVRTDSLKGRRGRLPSKPKSPHHLAENVQSPPMSTIASLLKAHDETDKDKTNLDFSRFSENVVDLQMDTDSTQSSSSAAAQFLAGDAQQQQQQQSSQMIDQQVLSLLSKSLDGLITFVEKIPGFNELQELDKKILFQNSCLELFALRMAYRITPGNNFVILCNNIVLHRNQFMHTLGEWLPMIEELSNQLHSMNLDINAFVCLCALSVITERDGCQDSNQQIEQIENKIINSLRDHTIYNNEAQKKPNYFSRIITKLSELRTIGEFGHRIITKKIHELASQKREILELQRKIQPFEMVTTTTTAAADDDTTTDTIPAESSLGEPQHLLHHHQQQQQQQHRQQLIRCLATSTSDPHLYQSSTQQQQSIIPQPPLAPSMTNPLDFDLQTIATYFRDWVDQPDPDTNPNTK